MRAGEGVGGRGRLTTAVLMLVVPALLCAPTLAAKDKGRGHGGQGHHESGKHEKGGKHKSGKGKRKHEEKLKPIKKVPPPPGRDFYGVLPWELPSGEEFARMAMGGIGQIRISMYQGSVEPVQGMRDWRLYDQLVGDAAAGGIRISPMLFGSPTWMNAKPATLPVQTAAQETSWFSFVYEAAKRYGPGGRFWAEHPLLPYLPMTGWEVWNEPNISEYIGGQQPTVGLYAKALRVAANALRAASTEIKVVVGGILRHPGRQYGVPLSKYLDALYRQPRVKSLFDAVAVHPYAPRTNQVMRVLNDARQIMNRHRDGGTPIWVTELGWTTGGQNWVRSPYRTTPQVQARRLSRIFGLLLRNRNRLKLEKAFWHTWRDFYGGPNLWIQYMGLFGFDGMPKPSWTALTRITGGTVGGKITNLGFRPLPGPITPPGGPAQAPSSPPPQCILPGILC